MGDIMVHLRQRMGALFDAMHMVRVRVVFLLGFTIAPVGGQGQVVL